MRYYNQMGTPPPPTPPTPNPMGLADCSTFNNDCNCYYGGCTDATAQNYDATATCDNGTCIAGVFGCTDPTALGYSPGATYDDGSCGATAVIGCTDPTAANHNQSANTGCGWTQGPAVPSPGGGGGVPPTPPSPPNPQAFAGLGAYSNFNERGFGGINDTRRGTGFVKTDDRPFVMSSHHLNYSGGCQSGGYSNYGGQLWF